MGAASVGYRHFDCAAVYGNEHLIGESLEIIMKGGIKREDLWITSKLWNDKHGEKDVIPACKKSLKDLRLDYLDLYLVLAVSKPSPSGSSAWLSRSKLEAIHPRGA